MIFENLGTFCISVFVNPLKDHLKKLHIIEVLLLLPSPEKCVGTKHLAVHMYCTYVFSYNESGWLKRSFLILMLAVSS